MKKVFVSLCGIFFLICLMFAGVHLAMYYGLTNTRGAVDSQQEMFLVTTTNPLYGTSLWSESEEWQTFMTAILKDEKHIEAAAEKAGVSARLIMAICAVEQLRLYYSERAIFEQIFSPLKILGVQSQFSWGVMGIKRETAIEIENRDEKKLLLPVTEEERFERLIIEDDRSWSYLYAAVFLREISDEWRTAGFPLEDRPGIFATLYNIGFIHSVPKENPQIGGAIIPFANREYTFGGLAHDIYYSDELLTEFPR
jgi:hypothetical protein